MKAWTAVGEEVEDESQGKKERGDPEKVRGEL